MNDTLIVKMKDYKKLSFFTTACKITIEVKYERGTNIMGRSENGQNGSITGYIIGGIFTITAAAAAIIGFSRISKNSDANHSSSYLDSSQSDISVSGLNPLPANVIRFDKKYGFDISKTKKCFKYYKRKTKNDALALSYTYDYIDSCYKDKSCNIDMSNTEKLTVTNKLLNRFDELNKKHKYSYSIRHSIKFCVKANPIRQKVACKASGIWDFLLIA